MASERPIGDFANDNTSFVDYVAKQQKSIEGIINRVRSTRVEYNTSKEEIAQMEETILEMKGLVEYELLLVSKKFSDFLHQIRNKLCEILDHQHQIIQENQKVLSERVKNQPQLGNYKLSQYAAEAIHPKVVGMNDDDLSAFKITTLQDLYNIKSQVQSVQREQSLNIRLTKKLVNSSEKLKKRIHNTIDTLSLGLEDSLKTLLPKLRFKDLQQYKDLKVTPSLGVKSKNTFEGSSAVLHFFEPGTTNLHYVDVAKTDKSGKPKWIHLEVNPPQSFPVYHSAVLSPSGISYITGGLNFDDLTTVQGTTLAYDFQSNTITKKAEMLLPRHGHASCHVKGKIYVFGGLSSDGFITNKCEVYDIATDKWSKIADMPTPASQCTVVKFGSKYIYKFGGYLEKSAVNSSIERYSIADNRWTTVVSLENGAGIVHPLSSGVQINSCQVLIFGGPRHNGSYVINVDEVGSDSSKSLVEYIGSIGQRDLTYGDGFWDNQHVVYDNKIYSLQNITKKEGTLSGQRHLVAYDGNEWLDL